MQARNLPPQPAAGREALRLAEAGARPVRDRASRWVWLSDELLLGAVACAGRDDEPVRAALVCGDREVALEVRRLAYPAPDAADEREQAGALLTIRAPAPERARADHGRIAIRLGDAVLTLDAAALDDAATDLRTLARDALTGLAPATRARILAFLARTPAEHGGAAHDIRLSRSLFALREMLRERLPAGLAGPEQRQAVAVDALLAVDERAFFISGWAWDREDGAPRLVVVSPEGSRVELRDRPFRYRRPDIEQGYDLDPDDLPAPETGFACYFELDAPSRLAQGWLVELWNRAGEALEVTAPAVIRDIITVRDRLLAELAHEPPPGEDLIGNHVRPALSRLQARCRAAVAVAAVEQYGTPPPEPDLSVIVPLYQQLDFLELQLSQFAHDPQLARADLIYVLDSPDLASPLKQRAAQLFRLYRVPFRLAVLSRNAGYSGANNAAAALARGRLLVLLNSDVLPDRPGWLGAMAAFYDATPGIGALGVKLLYEDDSLQHAGMYFDRPAGDPLWTTLHYFKGLHRSLPAANRPRPAPAVTGACLMIDRALYHRLGGLRDIYVQGDFEDSDLCLRLAEAGLENWYLPAVELYHLEGQSYPGELRRLTWRYNAWLHTRLWDEQIAAAMARQDGVTPGERPATTQVRTGE